jgi:eukaryotic-like serine/threonine-protein kinase
MSEPTPTFPSAPRDPSTPRLHPLADRLRQEQLGRWTDGDSPRVEEFLTRHPELANDPEGLLDLIYQEALLREERGETVNLKDYQRRFPQFHAALADQFAVHNALQSDDLFSTDATLKKPAASSSSAPSPAQGTPSVPGYLILRELGRGGMGVVYLARQERLNRLVALKMLLPGAEVGPEELARFRGEAEALARLRHPNIVPVHDIGEFVGRPYFVMEYVDGGSLAKRLSGTPLRPRDAAQLVETLARAIHVAHQAGVIHRDLKPANVLLGGEPSSSRGDADTDPNLPTAIPTLQCLTAPKITDFGLAKKLDDPSGPTQSGAILGTPSYMAPEQAAGKGSAIGPATDIYALGATLYEMLTGRPPFKAPTPIDTVLQVLSDEPVPPRRLESKLPRDLETICLKCLQKEPRKRYPTAEALAEDLHAFLAGETIQARPVSRLERGWRWCRRKPLAASLLAALSVVVVAGFVAVTALWLRSERNLQRADDNLDLANQNLERANRHSAQARRAIDAFFSKVADNPELKAYGLESVRKEWLEAATEYLDEVNRDQSDDPAFQAERGSAYRRLGLLTGEIGSPIIAIELHEQARDIFTKLADAYQEVAAYRKDLASCHNSLALLYTDVGRFDDALTGHQTALKLQQELAHDAPAAAEYQEALSVTYNNLAVFHRLVDRQNDAENALQQALGLLSDLSKNHAEEPRYRFRLASSRGNLANLYKDTHRAKKSETAYHEAIKTLDDLIEAFPTRPEYENVKATNLNSLASLYSDDRDRLKLAEETYEAALAIRIRLVNTHPSSLEYQLRLAQVHTNLGRLYNRTNRFQSGTNALRTSIDIYDKLVRGHPTVHAYQSNLATAWNNLANLYSDRRLPEAAEEAYFESAAIREKLPPELPAYQEDLASSYFNLGNFYKDNGRPDASETYYLKSVTLRNGLAERFPQFDRNQNNRANAYFSLARLLRTNERYENAETNYRTAHAIWGNLVERRPDVVDYALALGKSSSNLGQYLQGRAAPETALSFLDAAITQLEPLVAREKPIPLAKGYLRETLASRAQFLGTLDRHLEALPDWERASALAEDVAIWSNLEMGRARALADLQNQARDLARERKYVQATRIADTLAEQKYASGITFYRAAAAYALSSEAVVHNDALPEAERQQLSDVYAKRAVDLLRKTATYGNFDDQAGLDKLKQDDDFKSIRSRDDYRMLIDKLQAKLNKE